jgi:hypothetical protein
MCRNIRNLFNFDPPATDEEIQNAALQYVRKISGFTKPSAANEAAFNQAVDDVAAITQKLVQNLVTSTQPKDRETEAKRRREKNAQRFGAK